MKSFPARLLVVVVTLAALHTSFSRAAAQSVDRLMAEGSSQLQRRQWSEAERTFQEVMATGSADPDVLVLLGIAEYHEHSYDAAAGSLQRAIGMKTRYGARALYYLGMSYSELGQRGRASDTFAQLLRDFPDSPEADRVRRASPARRPKHWSFQFMQSAAMDDNPIRGSRIEDVTLLAPEPDYVLTTFVSASKRLKGAPFLLEGSLFRNDYAQTDQLDLLGAIVTAKGVFEVSARTSVLPLIEFQHTRLDGQPFESQSTAGLQWMHTGPGHWFYQALARYSLNTYPDEQFAILDGREAGLNLDVARHGGVHSPLAQFSLNLRARSVWADSDYLGFVDSGGRIGVQLRAGRRVNLDVGTGLFRRTYNATDPSFGVRREDSRWSSQILLTTRVVKHLLFRLDGTFIDNRANVDRYTYRQLVWGGALLVVY